jgi:predicted permease
MGGIVFVLLIAVFNISNLLLVRAVEREQEVAIQRALGASRSRIVVSLLVEGTLLALAGGAAGFLATLWGVDLLLRLVPDRLPRVADIHVDTRVFFFAMLTSVAAGLLVSLGPALQSVRTDTIEHLKAAGRSLHGGERSRLRNALVIAQVAIALVLLAGAALLVRSLWNLQVVDTGIDANRLATARLWLPQPNDPPTGPYFEHPRRVALMRRIVAHLHESADVAHAGLTTALPTMADSGTASFAAEGWTMEQRELASATAIAVTPGYFQALGIPLVSGRLLAESDDERSPRAVVVNQTLARTYFPNEDPVGRRYQFVSRRGRIAPDAPWITPSSASLATSERTDSMRRFVRRSISRSGRARR